MYQKTHHSLLQYDQLITLLSLQHPSFLLLALHSLHKQHLTKKNHEKRLCPLTFFSLSFGFVKWDLGIWLEKNDIFLQHSSGGGSLVLMNYTWSQILSRLQVIWAWCYVSCSQAWCSLPILPTHWTPCSWVWVVFSLWLGPVWDFVVLRWGTPGGHL